MRPTVTPEGLGQVPPTIPPTTPPMAPPTPPAMPPEVRDKLTNIMQALLLKTHELSFEYSTLDCETIKECPLALKSRELFKVVKNLNALVKEMTPPPKTEYVA